MLKTQEDEEVRPVDLSSGESEVLALGVEILHFFETREKDRINLLLIDEPDVHMHPDLQARLARFLIQELEALPQDEKECTRVCIATHSMPLVAQCATYSGCSIGIKAFGSAEVVLEPTSTQFKKLAPFFGHPLSLMIGNDLPLIIEGEDDERIWQQAGRTANGKLKIFPCVAQSVNEQTSLETECDRLMRAIYDTPRAISLRDGDGKTGDLEAIGCVERYRLQCYAAENLLLTDNVLATLGTNWSELLVKIEDWLLKNSTHKDIELVRLLQNSADRLRHTKIKDIRQLIPAICDSTKPWEVVVGQAIGRLDGSEAADEHSLIQYIGAKTLRALGLCVEKSMTVR